MQLKPYWQDTAPRFMRAAAGPVDGAYDVAVIGGGFTGLSAARHLAKSGASVVVLEADKIGSGASGRNGGHLNNGVAHGFTSAKAALGAERATALYRAFDESVATIERLVAEEGIDCAFHRCGKLKLASKPAHFDALARDFDVVQREVDPDTALLGAKQVRAEVGSTAFHGAMLFGKSAMMHMGRFATGMADAAVRHGAKIFEDAAVTGRRLSGDKHEIVTARGKVTAKEVMVATGAYTSGPFDYFRRRIVPVGSFIIATRPLSDAEIAATMPGNRNCVTSMNIGNYFRMLPDKRLLFGGRARFSASANQKSDTKSGAILRASLARIFPHLADIEVDYCWGGLVDMTQDRFPRAGRADGVWYAMGYSGHGAQISTYMGTVMADLILGKPDRNPVGGLEWPAIAGYAGKPWFLPMVGLYYKMLDRFQ